MIDVQGKRSGRPDDGPQARHVKRRKRDTNACSGPHQFPGDATDGTGEVSRGCSTKVAPPPAGHAPDDLRVIPATSNSNARHAYTTRPASMPNKRTCPRSHSDAR